MQPLQHKFYAARKAMTHPAAIRECFAADFCFGYLLGWFAVAAGFVLLPAMLRVF